MRHGLVYDGEELGYWLECNVSRPIAPPVRIDAQEIPGRDGTVIRDVTFGPLEIPVMAKIRRTGLSVAELRHMLAPLLVKTEPKRLQLPDDQYYHYAILSGESDLDRLFERGKAELVFYCPDPIGYGEGKSVSVPSSGSVSFIVGGTSVAYPRITASVAKRGTGDVWGLTLDNTAVFKAPISSAAAVAVSADSSTRLCQVANAVTLPTLDSDWLTLQPGTHTLRNHIGSGACTVEFVERWV